MKKSKLKLVPMALKASRLDQKIFKKKAKKHADGNVSEWMRRAAKEYEPKLSAAH